MECFAAELELVETVHVMRDVLSTRYVWPLDARAGAGALDREGAFGWEARLGSVGTRGRRCGSGP